MSKKSPDLEVISNPITDRASAMERRRLPRLNLTTEQFRLAQNGKVFSVADLSSGGIAFRVLVPTDLDLFPIGEMIDGTINLKGEKYSIKARVRHRGIDLVGCQFEELDSKFNDALNRFLDPVSLGQDLKPVPAEQGGPLWYHGPSGTDLLLWRKNDGRYHRFVLYLLGSFAQWDEEKGISTGHITPAFEQSDVRGTIRFETMLLNTDPRPDEGKLNIAKTLIMSSNIPQDLKKWCERQLNYGS